MLCLGANNSKAWILRVGQTWGQCFAYNFGRKYWHFSFKTNVMIQFLKKTSNILSKNRPFFGENV
jgi:hypothetical protein